MIVEKGCKYAKLAYDYDQSEQHQGDKIGQPFNKYGASQFYKRNLFVTAQYGASENLTRTRQQKVHKIKDKNG